MASFTYRAMDESSKVVAGRLQAKSELELERQLGLQGLTLIEASAGGLALGDLFALKFTDQDLLDFTYFLRLIVNSGISLMTGLNDVAKNHGNKKMLHANRLLYEGVESGLALSEVMRANPHLFPGFYTQMIRAGELSGTMDKSLDYLMSYLEWQIGFRKTVKSGLSYPLIIASIMAMLLIILVVFVFPALVKLMSGLGAQLPLPTRIILAFSNLIKGYYLPIGLCLAAAVAGFRVWRRTPDGRRATDRLILNLPLVGGVVSKVNLSRYFKQLHTLHSSGLNIQMTFTTAAESVDNALMAERFTEVTEAILTGDSISQALEKSGVVDPLTVDMVSLGEKTGNLESALLRVTEIFDREVPETIKKVFTYVEPLTILLMGGVVLLMLLSIFLPIYKVVGHIKT